MEEAETEVGGEGGVDRAVDGAKAKDELLLLQCCSTFFFFFFFFFFVCFGLGVWACEFGDLLRVRV